MNKTSRCRAAAIAACLATTLASAAAFAAPSWMQPAYDAGQTWYNPAETTLKPGNVKGLRLVKSQQEGYNWVGPVTQGGGTLFLCSDKHGLDARDQVTGRSRWTSASFGGGACLTAPLGEGVAYVSASATSAGSWINTLTAVDANSGSNLWQVSGQPDPPFPQSSWLEFNTPTLSDGGLFVTHRRSLVSAYDAATGALRWSTATGFLNNQATVAGGLVFTSTWGLEGGPSNVLFAHRVADGSLAWSQPTDSSNSEYPAAAAGGRVFVGSDSGGVRGYDAATGAPLWSIQHAGYIAAPLVATSTTVIANIGNSNIVAMDPQSGTTQWTATPQASDHLSSNMVLAGNVLYFVTCDLDGAQHLNAVDARTGRGLVRLADSIFGSYSGISVAGGRVYVTSLGTLLVYALH